MSEKLPSNQPQPIVKIGHYTLGQTLGVGTFGKVKSMCVHNIAQSFYTILLYLKLYTFSFDTIRSWGTCFDETQSCCEDFESSKNQEPRCRGQNSQRNTKSQALQTSSYH